MAASLASSFPPISIGINDLGCGDLKTHCTLSSEEIKIAQLKLPEEGRCSGSQAHETPWRSVLA